MNFINIIRRLWVKTSLYHKYVCRGKSDTHIKLSVPTETSIKIVGNIFSLFYILGTMVFLTKNTRSHSYQCTYHFPVVNVKSTVLRGRHII